MLDTSAITAWTRGSVAVGELLGEIDQERGAGVIPLSCLVEAASYAVDGRDWLDLLIEHPATVVLTDEVDDWQLLASLRDLVGAYDGASAAWLALEHGVDVLTRHAERYAGIAKGRLALPFDDD